MYVQLVADRQGLVKNVFKAADKHLPSYAPVGRFYGQVDVLQGVILNELAQTGGVLTVLVISKISIALSAALPDLQTLTGAFRELERETEEGEASAAKEYAEFMTDSQVDHSIAWHGIA
jgi:hypothetical protein